MNTRKDIQDELKELNSLLPLEKEGKLYSVPQGYFEGFAASVLKKIKEENSFSVKEELELISPVLAGISKKMPFSVPNDYFNHTTEGLEDWVKGESLPAFLQDAKKLPYTPPATNYFEDLPDIILNRVSRREAKVISLPSSSKWMRYAVAAIITGVIASSSVLYFRNNKSVDPSAQPQEWLAKTLKNVPDKELDEFINTTAVGSTAIAKTGSADETEVRKLLKDIPDTELDKFLNEVPADSEDLSVFN